MKNNGWLRLALISFVGIITVYAVLWLGSVVLPGTTGLAPGGQNQQHNQGGFMYDMGPQYQNQFGFQGQYQGPMMQGGQMSGMGQMGGMNMSGGLTMQGGINGGMGMGMNTQGGMGRHGGMGMM